MVDYLSQVKPLEDAGLSDADIAYALANQTAGPIPCYDAKLILEESGLVVEDPVTGGRSGTLIDFYQGLAESDIKKLTGWFISHCFGRGNNVATQEYPRNVQVAMVMDSLPADMQGEADALIALGGGKPWAGTVEADVVASRDAYNAEQAEQAAQQATLEALNNLESRYAAQYNEKIAPLIGAQNTTEADWISAIQEMSSEF